MTELASLAVEVNSVPVKEFTAALHEMIKAGATSEQVMRSMEKQGEFTTESMDKSRVASFAAAEAWKRQAEQVQGASDEVQKILNRYDPLGTKLRQLQTDLAKVNEAITHNATGGTSEPALDNTVRLLNAEIGKTKGLMEQAGVGIGGAAHQAMGLGLNTQMARRELLMLGREAISGDFSRMPQTFMSLASHSNLLKLALSPVGLAIGAMTVPVIALVVAFFSVRKEMEEVNNALAATSNYAGQSRDSIIQLAQAVSDANTITIGAAKGIVTALVASGRIGAESISSIAMLVDNYASTMGKDISKVTPELIKLFTDPAKGLATLNETLHKIDPSFVRYIKNLQDIGELERAQKEAADKLLDIYPKHKDQIDLLGGAWAAATQFAGKYWDKAKQALVPGVVLPLGFPTATGPSQTSGKSATDNREQTSIAVLAAQGSEWTRINKLKADNILLDKVLTTDAGILLDVRRAYAKNEEEISNILLQMGAKGRAIANERVAAALKNWEVEKKGSEDTIGFLQKIGAISSTQANARRLELALEDLHQKKLTDQAKLALGVSPLQRQTLNDNIAGYGKQAGYVTAASAQKTFLEEFDLKRVQAELDAKAIQAAVTGQQKVNDGIVHEIENLKQHNREIGKTKEQVDLLKAAEQDRVILKAQGALGDARYEAEDSENGQAQFKRLEAQLALLKERQAVQREGAALEGQAAAIKKQGAEWDKMWASVEHTGKQAFVQLMTGGKSAFEAIGQALKTSVIDLLYEMTMKKWIIDIGTTAKNASGGDLLGLAAKFFGVGGTSAGGTSAGEIAMANAAGVGYGGAQAAGGDYLVTKPTLFIAGEAGAERASFSGANNTGNGKMPNITFNFINPPGEPLSAKQSAPRFDMGQMIMDVVLTKVHSDVNVRNSLRGALGAPV